MPIPSTGISLRCRAQLNAAHYLIWGTTLKYLTTSECMLNAQRARIAIPAFNTPYLPMMEAVVAALRDSDTFGLITVARLEWIKFEAQSLQAIRAEYERVKDERFTRLHLDHVPVIDEDNLKVDYEAVIQEAIQFGYGSVMVDGSRLPLEENIQATGKITRMAHAAGIPVEGELGAVLGHEAGPSLPMRSSLPAGKGSRPRKTPSASLPRPAWTGFRLRSGTFTAPFPE